MSDLPERAVADDVEREITRLLRRARNGGLRQTAEIHADLDFGTYLLLLALQDAVNAGSSARATDLAATFEVHKSTISRGLATLERLGLIRREPDPEDGRARLIRLSDEASERVRESRAARRDQLIEALEDWSPDELSTLATLLERLNAAYE